MTGSRGEFHRQHQEQATAKAVELLACQPPIGKGRLTWVAGQLYTLRPAAYASMVRRELARLQDAA